MVTWSLETLNLFFIVVAIIVTLYISFKVYQHSVSVPGALVFFLSIPAYWYGRVWVGSLIMGAALIVAQLYYTRKNWMVIGRFYVYVVICWAGSTAIDFKQTRRLIPMSASRPAEVQQTGAQSQPDAVEAQLPIDGANVWYRKSGAGTGTPVILVHGGPGVGSFYLKPLEALGDDRPVVRYDQLGAGRSDVISDTTLFNIPRFVAELDSLRSALGYERIHVVGHSWGTIVGFEYYRAHPERVASLTLASPALSIPEWIRNVRRLVTTLSDSSQAAIRNSESVGDYDSPDYQNAVGEFYGMYVWRQPQEADLDSTMKTMNQAMYMYMQGPSEFTITGTLKTYDATRYLRTVKVPTLYTVGEFDEADTATVKRFASRTPGARVEIIPGAAHITTWDNPDVMIRVVREFLRAADSLAAAPPTP